MQLTRAADYAVRVMIYLASLPEGTVVSKSLLAKEAEAPDSFLSKILQTLSRAGLIRAQRGVVGGFSLLPRGAQASVLDVVESIDGPTAINVCLVSDASCGRYSACTVHEVWRQAQSAMLSVLSQAKIAEMAPATAGHLGTMDVVQASSPGRTPRRSIKARSQTAPDGAIHITHKKQS